MYTAQEVIKDKFWIVNNAYGKVGTLRFCDDGRYEFYNQSTEEKTYISDPKELVKFSDNQRDHNIATENATVEGFPTGYAEITIVDDYEFPTFKKSKNSRTIHAAGYWIIKFDSVGWQWALAPKIATLDKYYSKGPFLTEWEASLEMRKNKRGPSYEIQNMDILDIGGSD